MKTLSVCVIAKNEEAFLEKSLQSIAPVADEIIFVDTGSTDKTVEIAKKFTKKIHFFEWIDDFAAAQNYCSRFATKDFELKWDADFFVETKYVRKLKALKNRGFDGHDLVGITWRNIDTASGEVSTSVIRDLIFEKEKYKYIYPIHVKIVPKASHKPNFGAYKGIVVDHYKNPNEKSHRYLQTKKILQKTMKANPSDAYLKLHLIDGLLHAQEYVQALQAIDTQIDFEQDLSETQKVMLIEKRITCLIYLDRYDDAKAYCVRYVGRYDGNAQFTLIWADVESVFNPNRAIELYKRFLKQYAKQKNQTLYHNYNRYWVHPYQMLSMLYRLSGQNELSMNANAKKMEAQAKLQIH